MDETDPLEARDQRLAQLRTTDPVAWAITQGKRGLLTIAEFLRLPPNQVTPELQRLIRTKQVKAIPYHGTKSYRPQSQEMKRLTRRAYTVRRKEDPTLR
jgi:hypothetical protein